MEDPDTAEIETSAGLLSFVKFYCGLPEVNEEMSDDRWWMLLSLAQESVFQTLVTHIGHVMYVPPERMYTLDGGFTYQFERVPHGQAEIRESRIGWVMQSGAEFNEGADYTIEGERTIRWTNNDRRVFPGGGPWARYAVAPSSISATKPPTLLPRKARVCIAWKALELWAMRAGRRDPSPYSAQLQRWLWGDPSTPGMVGIIAEFKTQHINQGGVDAPSTRGRWWDNPDLRRNGGWGM
jgi:hypothetical protein